MHCSSSASQATAQLFITSYQKQFLSHPDIFLSNIFKHLNYASNLSESNTRIVPALNKEHNYCFVYPELPVSEEFNG
jgi:hypothetical protein